MHAHFVCGRVYSVTGEKPHTLTALIHDKYSMMCDQNIRVNWKRNIQLQRIVHYFIISLIISAAMLCTSRTLLVWDLSTRMIVELTPHVADMPPKRIFLELFKSSLIPVVTLWSEFMHTLCVTECTAQQKRKFIHWPQWYTIYPMMCDQKIRVNWKRNTQLQRIVHYFIVTQIVSAVMLCTSRIWLLWDFLTHIIVEINSHVADKPPKRMFL